MGFLVFDVDSWIQSTVLCSLSPLGEKGKTTRFEGFHRLVLSACSWFSHESLGISLWKSLQLSCRCFVWLSSSWRRGFRLRTRLVWHVSFTNCVRIRWFFSFAINSHGRDKLWIFFHIIFKKKKCFFCFRKFSKPNDVYTKIDVSNTIVVHEALSIRTRVGGELHQRPNIKKWQWIHTYTRQQITNSPLKW